MHSIPPLWPGTYRGTAGQ